MLRLFVAQSNPATPQHLHDGTRPFFAPPTFEPFFESTFEPFLEPVPTSTFHAFFEPVATPLGPPTFQSALITHLRARRFVPLKS